MRGSRSERLLFEMLASRRQWEEMDRFFIRLTAISWGFYLLGAATVCTGVWVLNELPYELTQRLASRMLPLAPHDRVRRCLSDSASSPLSDDLHSRPQTRPVPAGRNRFPFTDCNPGDRIGVSLRSTGGWLRAADCRCYRKPSVVDLDLAPLSARMASTLKS